MLTELCLEHNRISKEGADALGMMLQANEVLRTLLLGSNGIRDEGLLEICKGIQGAHSGMKHLGVQNNSITPNGGRLLAKCLFASRTIERLVLAGNALGGDGASMLGEGLRYSPSLTHLDLSSNALGDKGLSSFLRCFKIVGGGLGKKARPPNMALQNLDVSGNNLSEEACAELMRAVAKHK